MLVREFNSMMIICLVADDGGNDYSSCSRYSKYQSERRETIDCILNCALTSRI